ncbi:MAG: LamG domain-containing protein [Lentisphaerae bacterium]|mgnify:CR=1 FL=1|jgi:hypothetical protein|nr:LamG domain-containing protein [Lentisphaerota bacterium]MBT4818237.1 LamG domain-containing protein [Lentisphaerota bacterium]MBT5611146.1 LamG domain-containing protein [Lentisphaerota bacterium]MBT7054730.1 LamG domain-containing protein [Lentisphaerota bacterium]MBT7841988.1 LamG domain-containing protein [Lentisphaerota bacterium]
MNKVRRDIAPRRSLLPAAVSLVLAWTVVTRAEQKSKEADWRGDWRGLAEQGDGFIIWESNRTGRWRLWRRRLDGSELRQISPEEKGREHFCPHISPDGRHVVYLSYPSNTNTYKPIPKGGKCPLHIMRTDGKGDRILVPSARAYFEDRGAVWLSDTELIYIGGAGRTYQLNIKSGKRLSLTKAGHKEYGFLLDRGKSVAVQGSPTFSIYDRKSQAISPRKSNGGCQPYFSHDGVWGFWTGGAGGPLKRIHLATRKISHIIEKNDPRMPTGRRYLYFPMFSRCGRLFAFASSPNQHDHFKSDYDIFVARSDPKTLQLIGKPVRYSFDKGCDRFPDAFLADLALGRHRGEAPFAITLKTGDKSASWQWSVDGRAVARGAVLRHRFPKAGTFEVTARSGNARLRGEVTVAPARVPALVQAVFRNTREIALTFDEPVQARKATFELDSRTPVAKWRIAPGNTTLVLTLGSKAPTEDGLRISGITDRAQAPNTMPPKHVKLTAPIWPTKREGLVFVWETANRPNLVSDPGTGRKRTYALKPRGRARLNHDFAAELAGGAYLVEGADTSLLQACRETNELTVEALVRPANLTQGGPARIVTFSTDPGSRNFTLGQQKDALVFRLRTPRTGRNGTNPEATLCKVAADKLTHVVVTYRAGQMTCYQNGKQAMATQKVQGDLSNWAAAHLLIGDEWTNDRDWSGQLEGVAIYSRALGSEEVKTNAAAYHNKLRARARVPRYTVEGTIVAASAIPSLKKIAPYREALACSEVTVTSSRLTAAGGDAAASLPKRIRIVQWVILDGQTLPAAKLSAGTRVSMELEPFDLNPQLARFYVSDTLEEDFDVPLYFAAGEPGHTSVP